MAILKVLKHPDPRLKNKAKKVKEITEEIQQNISDMIETMYHDNGGGLAAIQVGLPIRIFTMDDSGTTAQPKVFINPEIIDRQGKMKSTEGCLSFPGIEITIERAKKVKILALDRDGNEFTEEYYDNYACRCVQHEIDHLDGIIFFDRLSPLKRKMIEKKYSIIKKQNK